MAGIKYHLSSERKMQEPGVYLLPDGGWLVRVRSKRKGATGRLSVSSLGKFKTEQEANEAYNGNA